MVEEKNLNKNKQNPNQRDINQREQSNVGQGNIGRQGGQPGQTGRPQGGFQGTPQGRQQGNAPSSNLNKQGSNLRRETDVEEEE